MTLITTFIIAVTIALVLIYVLFRYAEYNDSSTAMIAEVLATILSLVTALSLITYMIGGGFWFAADYKAKIINSEYGTNYTQADVFYASSVIDTIRQLDRKRVEINGDLMRGKKPPASE